MWNELLAQLIWDVGSILQWKNIFDQTRCFIMTIYDWWYAMVDATDYEPDANSKWGIRIQWLFGGKSYVTLSQYPSLDKSYGPYFNSCPRHFLMLKN